MPNYTYNNSLGLASLVANTPDPLKEYPAILPDAIRQIKAYLCSTAFADLFKLAEEKIATLAHELAENDKTVVVGDFIHTTADLEKNIGWLLCDGAPYSPTTYPKLFDLIGTIYGGTETTPLLPNFTEKILVNNPGLPLTAITLTLNQLPPHRHYLFGLANSTGANIKQTDAVLCNRTSGAEDAYVFRPTGTLPEEPEDGSHVWAVSTSGQLASGTINSTTFTQMDYHATTSVTSNGQPSQMESIEVDTKTPGATEDFIRPQTQVVLAPCAFKTKIYIRAL